MQNKTKCFIPAHICNDSFGINEFTNDLFLSWLGRSQLIISQGYGFSVQATIFSRLLFVTAQLVAHLRRDARGFSKEA